MDIFEQRAQQTANSSRPLAERMRPLHLDEFIGHENVVGEGKLIRHAVEKDQIFSMILWGPPGCGKTTLARIVAGETKSHFSHFSAVLSGVKDIRSVIDAAKDQLRMHRRKTILFVDEIHRFNKAQQDAFLHHVESGLITLIGATTENPSFEVISPLLSRCRVITLDALSEKDILEIMAQALRDKDRGLGKFPIEFEEDALSYIVRISGGDARIALNSLEIAAALARSTDDSKESKSITIEDTQRALQEQVVLHDKGGESHYNLISAFHKSLRGSDPDAALYWLGRMLLGGEDPLYIARRMVRFASEDIGNADPQALSVTLNAMEAFRFLGHPEGELALAQAALYLATAPKSNSIYAAFENTLKTVKNTGSPPVPLHIRNAPTSLMKDLGYGKDYKYAHNYRNAFVYQEYLPDKLAGTRFYLPTDRGYEKIVKQRLDMWRRRKAKNKNKP